MRVASTSITEKIFNINGKTFSFIDVVGQGATRNKWATYFNENLNGIVFVTSISAYDQIVEDNLSDNRYTDSLQCFRKLLEHKLLKKVSIIVMFNKSDLFQLKKTKFGDYITEYKGIYFNNDRH